MASLRSSMAYMRGFEALTSGSAAEEELEVDELSIEMIFLILFNLINESRKPF